MASPMTGVQRFPQRTRNPAAKNSAPKTRMDGSKKPNWTITARSATPVYTSPANITRIANGFCRRPPTRSDVASMSPLGAPHSGFRISTLRRAAVGKHGTPLNVGLETFSSGYRGAVANFIQADATCGCGARNSVRGGRSREARRRCEARTGTRRRPRAGPRGGGLPNGPPPPRRGQGGGTRAAHPRSRDRGPDHEDRRRCLHRQGRRLRLSALRTAVRPVPAVSPPEDEPLRRKDHARVRRGPRLRGG